MNLVHCGDRECGNDSKREPGKEQRHDELSLGGGDSADG
jgi:hypothetical protein